MVIGIKIIIKKINKQYNKLYNNLYNNLIIFKIFEFCFPTPPYKN